jgi:hypothetical protein
MAEKMVVLATFSDPVEAGLARNHLAAEGISAFLTGELASGAFAGLEGHVGGIQLHVSEAEVERAGELLAAAQYGWQNRLADALERAGELFAPATEDIRAKERSPAAESSTDIQAPVDSPLQTRLAAEEPPVDEAAEREEAGAVEQTAPDEEEPEDRLDRSMTWTPDDFADRAWKAAVFGLLACPPLGHFYSLRLLLRLAAIPDDLSLAGTRKVYGAIVIDGIVLLLFASFIPAFLLWVFG